MQSHCPIGRMKITGTITRVQDRKNEFETKTYITVRTDEGHIVTGTKPRGVMPTVGNRVEFVATVKRGDIDPYHGYFKNHRDGRTLSFVQPPAIAPVAPAPSLSHEDREHLAAETRTFDAREWTR